MFAPLLVGIYIFGTLISPSIAATPPSIQSRDLDQPFNTNLLRNGGFEAPTFSPWKHSRTASIENGAGVNSSRGVYCPKDCMIAQKFETVQYNFYRLGLNYRIQSPRLPSYRLQLDTAGLFGLIEPPSTAWQRVEVWFEAPHRQMTSGLSLYLDLYLAGERSSNQYYVDNVRIERVPGSFAPTADARELLKNAGFESGAIAPWTTKTIPKTKFEVISPGIGSAYALHFTGGSLAEPAPPSSLIQTVNVVPGRDYLVRYTVVKQDRGANYGELTVDGVSPVLPRTQIHNGTLHFALPFRAQTHTMKLHLELSFGPLLLDNFSIKELAQSSRDGSETA